MVLSTLYLPTIRQVASGSHALHRPFKFHALHIASALHASPFQLLWYVNFAVSLSSGIDGLAAAFISEQLAAISFKPYSAAITLHQ